MELRHNSGKLLLVLLFEPRRLALVPFLNDTLRVNTSGGTISDAQAAAIENTVNAKLASALVGPGAAVATSVVVDRTNDVLATKTLRVTVRVLPFAYPAFITLDIGFTANI